MWKAKVHYRVYKIRLLFSVLRQIYPVHTLLSYVLKIYFNIILNLP